MAGVLVRLAKTSPTGLTKLFHILRSLSEAQESDIKMIEMDKECLEEINFWCNERQILPMGSDNFASIAVSLKQEDPTFKKRKIHEGKGFASDSSGSYWAAKANKKASCGKIPVELSRECISTKEAFALEQGVKLLERGQKAIMNVDSVVLHHAFTKRRSKQPCSPSL